MRLVRKKAKAGSQEEAKKKRGDVNVRLRCACCTVMLHDKAYQPERQRRHHPTTTTTTTTTCEPKRGDHEQTGPHFTPHKQHPPALPKRLTPNRQLSHPTSSSSQKVFSAAPFYQISKSERYITIKEHNYNQGLGGSRHHLSVCPKEPTPGSTRHCHQKFPARQTSPGPVQTNT
ncbi:uncharacterized protein B0T23DRAFT_173611 [Neurospora hispaniola]|uniref:Uncharacterized protein n=1 Tax=Neurospora hispaniola TaxID=588809 RepID=A0AAJ0I6B4_9PEZI|nr:hypothetical protein B0T23DRAFT_173611 [Neurospora hispaniola]